MRADLYFQNRLIPAINAVEACRWRCLSYFLSFFFDLNKREYSLLHLFKTAKFQLLFEVRYLPDLYLSGVPQSSTHLLATDAVRENHRGSDRTRPA